jgi:hypothetical protein
MRRGFGKAKVKRGQMRVNEVGVTGGVGARVFMQCAVRVLETENSDSDSNFLLPHEASI